MEEEERREGEEEENTSNSRAAASEVEERSSSSNSTSATLVWSWGAGTDGQLCTTKLQDEHLPQFLSFTPKQPISHLACGGAHAIALTKYNGRVLTWGRGTSGQLGHGETKNCLYPIPVKTLERFVISHASAGWNHSGFVSDCGRVFTCGDGSFGQLGHGDYKSQTVPTEILYWGSKCAGQIACGVRHSLVLLKAHPRDPVYGFGAAKRGQVGVAKDRMKKSFNLPEVIFGLEDVEVVAVTANGDHSAALTVDGHLFTWGRGFPGSSDAYDPLLLASPWKFKQVALGWNHALVLTDEGEVFMLGGYLHGMLSDPQKTSEAQGSSNKCHGSADNNRITPLVKVPGLSGIEIVHIAAGAEHSALLTGDGRVMTWGWGEHGQLGLGDVFDRTIPEIVNLDHVLPKDQLKFRVYCGSGFSFAVGGSLSSES